MGQVLGIEHIRFSDSDNPFPKGNLGTFAYEADIIKLCWGAFLGPAYDANKNGVVDDSEQGPGLDSGMKQT